MAPKGNLLIIGGAEDIDENDAPAISDILDGFERYEILRELIQSSRKKKIEIVTTGSMVPHEVKKRYQKVFYKIGHPHPTFIHIQNRMEAQDPAHLKRAEEAGAVFFTGGDQFRISTILGGTGFIDIIKRRYYEDKNFLVAGTSAGAMVMSEVMITEGGVHEALVNRELKTSSGLGFLRNCIIDTHFIKRGRFGRLAHAIMVNPEQLGIGLGEDTALIIKKGDQAECLGSGMVVIIDGKNIQQTNVTEAKEGETVFVENLRVHLLVKGCRFSIKRRKLANPAIAPKKIG